ncbi:MAG: glutamate--tRNA ligase [Nanoarchaeota archaeon]|nr:glutamate--tRNA ligase [Nanoarchaeota archaeon]
MKEISKEVIKAYALENAIKYEGKANQGAVLAALFAEGLEKSKIKEIMPTIQKIIKEVESLSIEEQKSKFESLGQKTSKRVVRVGLPKLENAIEGKVVMRFAPFPSGPLHIGNTRTLILNDEYAKMYNGKLLIVMDDTIGSEQKPIIPESYKLIEEAIKYLEIKHDPKILYKSNRIEKYYEYAKELIKKGYLYVCDCENEKRKELKIQRIECSCRQFKGVVQLQRWEKLFKAPEGSCCVRLKTSMIDPDPAFRDRIMFRITDRPHAILANKYRVYPLLDFSWAIDDHVFGITHILRGMELAIETRTEKFIWDIFGWTHPTIIYNGHFEIEGIKLSKSKGAVEVKSGTYIGWNDPRSWSVQSLMDRGITPIAIREFILNMGVRKTNITIPVDVLYSLNKKEISNCPRYFFLRRPIKIKIKTAPNLEKEIPYGRGNEHSKRAYKTNQDFLIDQVDLEMMEDSEYRLMNLLTFNSSNILRAKPRDFHFIATLPEKNKKLKSIVWLPDNNENVNVVIRYPDNEKVKGLGEPKLKELKEGTIIYFENFGYVKLYKKSKEDLEFWFAHI